MELRVTGWRYENIRGGVRNISIDLEEAPRWTLIQMPNGTGKTTTMTLLRAALTGVELSPREVDELRADDEVEAGLFELRLSIDDKPYRVQLDLDFIGRKARYSTTRTQLHGGGSEPGWHLPPTLRRLLTPEFTRLFVFDGEFAKEIRAVDKDRTTKSIRTLYRLDQLDALRKDIKAQVVAEQERAAAVSRAKEKQGLTRLTNDVAKAEGVLDLLKLQLRNHQKERATKIERQAVLKAKVDHRVAQDKKFQARKAKLDQELADLNAQVAELTAGSLAAMRSPPKLSPVLLERLRSLGQRLTTLKLPKTISTEFFHELAHGERCVCETPITPDLKKAILAGASKYLAEDQITIINRMKRTVRESETTGAEFSGAADALRAKLRERRSVDQQLDQLQQEQIDSGDVELKELLIEVENIRIRVEELDDEIEVLSTTDNTRQLILDLGWEDNIPLCRKEVAYRKKKLATATQTANFVAAADRVTSLIDAVAEKALSNLRQSLCDTTNAKLAKLVLGEPLRIARIGTALELSSEGVASKAGVSEGQSLSVAYAFLTSLLSDAPYRLPFIVDSPAVSLDTQVRREVGEVIPELFDQMIMFVISSERDGFADAFYPREDCRFITIWRDGEKGTQMREGIDEFRAFHSAEPAAEKELQA
jgi:DNA sulfur modification protein DndD